MYVTLFQKMRKARFWGWSGRIADCKDKEFALIVTVVGITELVTNFTRKLEVLCRQTTNFAFASSLNKIYFVMLFGHRLVSQQVVKSYFKYCNIGEHRTFLRSNSLLCSICMYSNLFMRARIIVYWPTFPVKLIFAKKKSVAQFHLI